MLALSVVKDNAAGKCVNRLQPLWREGDSIVILCIITQTAVKKNNALKLNVAKN